MSLPTVMHRKVIDLTGQQFGFWKVLNFVGKGKGRASQWKCRCVCGREKIVGGQHLRAGASQSCGCKTAGLRGAALKGSRHYNWKGGFENPGSIAWCNGRLDSLRKGTYAPVVSTAEDVQLLWQLADGRCSACGCEPRGKRGLVLDHRHDTGIIRGFLCNHCNVALAMCFDEPEKLRACADYLERAAGTVNYKIARGGKVRTV